MLQSKSHITKYHSILSSLDQLRSLSMDAPKSLQVTVAYSLAIAWKTESEGQFPKCCSLSHNGLS